MPSTVKDIARELGLSTSTVCYALNGGPRTVREDVRRRVLDKARELDYRPNRLARSLAKGSTGTIGVVPPSVELNVFLSPFVQQAWNAIVNEAELLGMDILLFAGKNLNSPDDPGLGLLDGRIDGVVFIAPLSNARAVESAIERELPFASISSSEQLAGLHMTADNRFGIRAAIQHLVDLGHRKIAHLAGTPQSADAQSRRLWFDQTMAECGLPVPEGYVQEGSFTRSFGEQAGTRLLRRPDRPTAIVAANDEVACGACLAARSLGIEVPDELSVVGFDDTDLASVFHPPLTTVRQPIEEMASAAVRGVVDLVKGNGGAASTCFPTQLVVRSSTARAKEAVRA